MDIKKLLGMLKANSPEDLADFCECFVIGTADGDPEERAAAIRAMFEILDGLPTPCRPMVFQFTMWLSDRMEKWARVFDPESIGASDGESIPE